MLITVKVRSKGELKEMKCPKCNSVFYINPRKRRKKVFCPVCSEKILLGRE